MTSSVLVRSKNQPKNSSNGFWTQKSILLVVSELCPGQSSIIPNIGKTELLFFALLIYPMISIDLQSFLFISLIVSELCPRQSSKCKYEQRVITLKLGKAALQYCALHIYPMRSIYLQSVLFISIILCPGQCSKCKNGQRKITPK
jgi:hypothetical protein